MELGVEDLIHGQLTPRVVDTTTLNVALRGISRKLAKHKMRLCAQNAADVYLMKNFHFARRESDLFICIRLTFSGHEQMDVFRVHALQVPVPGDQLGLVSRLKGLPKFILSTPGSDSYRRTWTNGCTYDNGRRIKFSRLASSVQNNLLLQFDTKRTSGRDDFLTFRCKRQLSNRRFSSWRLKYTSFPIWRGWRHDTLQESVSKHDCVPCLIKIGHGCTLQTEELSAQRWPFDCDVA